MIPRRLPAVAFELANGDVYQGLRDLTLAREPTVAINRLAEYLTKAFPYAAAGLVDSGTSALRLAIRHVCRPGDTVAVPGFGCIDVGSAVMAEKRKIIAYDVKLTDFGPDLASVADAIAAGASAVIVSHLFGLPVDLRGVRALCSNAKVCLIEDASQWGGADDIESPIGHAGDVLILSFGRGKGIGCAGGGAILTGQKVGMSAEGANFSLAPLLPDGGPSRIRDVRVLFLRWIVDVLSRPSLYAIPAAVPWLALGEMRYRKPGEIENMSPIAAGFVLRAIPLLERARQQRYSKVCSYLQELGDQLTLTHHGQASPRFGWLRFPVVARRASSVPCHLGIVQPYPRHLYQQVELSDAFAQPHISIPNSKVLAESLLTLPTHSRTADGDVKEICTWLRQL